MRIQPFQYSQQNLGENERIVSVFGGGAAILFAMLRPSKASLPLTLGGGYLMYRGMLGRDPFYKKIGVRRVSAPGGKTGILVKDAITVNRPVEEVYDFWRDFTNFPSFMHNIKSISNLEPEELPGGGRPRSRWVAEGPMGIPVTWDAEISQEMVNEHIAWRSLPNSEIHHSGFVTFAPGPGNNQTKVIVEFKYYPPGGFPSAALLAIFDGDPSMQVHNDLRRFKEILETGETASVFGQPSGRLEEVAFEREIINASLEKDVVQEASEESFPASDSPTWAQGDRNEEESM